MAKPAVMQRLQKGKLLTGAAFPDFVDTWNYAVNRLENLKGDRDANPKEGHILVDNADPEHPVIRWQGELADGGLEKACAFSFDQTSRTISDGCYYLSGWHKVGDFSVTQGGAYMLAVDVNANRGQVVAGDAFAQTATSAYAYFPLYEFGSDLEVVHDWRGAPCRASEPRSGGGGEIRVVGTDGTTAVCKSQMTFASALSSNVRCSVAETEDGKVTVTVGAYYV